MIQYSKPFERTEIILFFFRFLLSFRTRERHIPYTFRIEKLQQYWIDIIRKVSKFCGNYKLKSCCKYWLLFVEIFEKMTTYLGSVWVFLPANIDF